MTGLPRFPQGRLATGTLNLGTITLAAALDSDLPFLRRLYRSTREAELAMTGWPDAAKQGFCDSQFDLQHAHYVRQYPQGDFLLVRQSQQDAGRLYVDDGPQALQLIDIALLPEQQGGGLGSALIRRLQEHAAAAKKPVTLQVLNTNLRARALYERLGFAAGEAGDIRLSMRWVS